MPGLRSELGGAGVEFVNAFMTTPLCCPSRSSILPRPVRAHHRRLYEHRRARRRRRLRADRPETIGTLLQSAGYRTGFIGKYLNGYNALWPNATDALRPGRLDAVGRLQQRRATSTTA